MAAENRLTADELAALTPGDTVTIESGADFGRRRHTTGTVARVTDRHVVVRCGSFVERYGIRDGLRDGGGTRAELVHNQDSQAQRSTRHIDEAYRDWTRSRSDLDRLRRLHETIGQVLEEHSTAMH